MKKEEFEALMLGFYLLKNNYSVKAENAKLYHDAVSDCFNQFLKIKSQVVEPKTVIDQHEPRANSSLAPGSYKKELPNV